MTTFYHYSPCPWWVETGDQRTGTWEGPREDPRQGWVVVDSGGWEGDPYPSPCPVPFCILCPHPTRTHLFPSPTAHTHHYHKTPLPAPFLLPSPFLPHTPHHTHTLPPHTFFPTLFKEEERKREEKACFLPATPAYYTAATPFPHTHLAHTHTYRLLPSFFPTHTPPSTHTHEAWAGTCTATTPCLCHTFLLYLSTLCYYDF